MVNTVAALLLTCSISWVFYIPVPRVERLRQEEAAEKERQLQVAKYRAATMEEFMKEREKEVLQLQVRVLVTTFKNNSYRAEVRSFFICISTLHRSGSQTLARER